MLLIVCPDVRGQVLGSSLKPTATTGRVSLAMRRVMQVLYGYCGPLLPW